MAFLSSSQRRRVDRTSLAFASVMMVVITVLTTGPQHSGNETGSGSGDDGAIVAQYYTQLEGHQTAVDGSGVAVANTGSASLPPLADPMPSQAETIPTLVTPVRPRVVFTDAPALAAVIADLPGVAIVSEVVIADVEVQAQGQRQVVTVAAVDPDTFRPLTPDVTALEDGVWAALSRGDAIFTHDAAARTGAVLGHEIALGRATLPVGAWASNGIPPIADVMVSNSDAETIGIVGRHDVYVAFASGVDETAMISTLSQTVGRNPERLTPPEPLTNQFGAVLTGSQARQFFEPFQYLDHGDGLITIDEGWVDRNIAVTTQMPLLPGRVQCHRQMLVQLYGALSEVEAAGLGDLIDPSQYGGCWVARHIDFNPSKPISMHGWGLAIDLNVSTNQLGAQPTLDPRIVAIFDRWGFVWGGRWQRPDGMHFELGAVVDVPVPEGFFE